MKDQKQIVLKLGYESPLVEIGRDTLLDQREISISWLSGTFLTGITSSLLMGIALLVALDNHQKISFPLENKVEQTDQEAFPSDNAKRGRILRIPQTIARDREKKRLEAFILKKEGDKDIIRSMQLVEINMNFDTDYISDKSYPAFDPMMICMDDEPEEKTLSAGTQIYTAKAESEMILKISPFPKYAIFDETPPLLIDEIEKTVRTAARILSDGEIKVASLHFTPPFEQIDSLSQSLSSEGHDMKIIPENFSSTPAITKGNISPYLEDIIPILSQTSIESVLKQANHTDSLAMALSQALSENLDSKFLPSGSVLRLYLETGIEGSKIVRASIYQGTQHIKTMALDDAGNYVVGKQPKANPILRMAIGSPDSFAPWKNSPRLSIYDSIYQAALSHGIEQPIINKLLQTLASSIDLQTPINAGDKLKLLFSNPSTKSQITKDSELLYIVATFSGSTQALYRYQVREGRFDYFDQNGQSSRQFLIRKPIPNGRFTSGFGQRHHPLLGYTKAHTGVDWSAPHGTPILAAGNGIVEKSGWESGYGKQTTIRHPNGYTTSYAHQSKIAKEIVPGARVRQGQIIGYIGSTGLSTGSHLHYELTVNGAKVDPMRIRLPAAHNLKGSLLTAFKNERKRIDEVIKNNAAPKINKIK